jgi:hypothetical protein
MTKNEALEECLRIIKKYGYISEDGVLDVCDEERGLVVFCIENLDKMLVNGDLTDYEWEAAN